MSQPTVSWGIRLQQKSADKLDEGGPLKSAGQQVNKLSAQTLVKPLWLLNAVCSTHKCLRYLYKQGDAKMHIT